MSLIDDVVNKKIPTGGKFQAKVGAGNLAKKLSEATRSGVLSNLKDNQELINRFASKRQGLIRSGKYGRSEREADYREALKDHNLTENDQRDLQAIFEHWSKGEVTKTPETKLSSKAIKINERKATIKAQLKPNPRRELPDFLQKQRGSISANSLFKPASSLREGGGGGIKAGLGGASASKPSTGSFRPPSLLK